jgi:pantoate--beta-alanine ligase
MKLIETTAELQTLAETMRVRQETIALVPTMGYLHEGHLSLMRIARSLADNLVVSIFVNPKQFGPSEDLDNYPRDVARDLELCRQEGVDVVFAPGENEVYPPGFQTQIHLLYLPEHLCGLSRPGFFGGVATVVTKLFNIVRPHVAVFGEKDYQQLLVVRQLAQDLNLPVEVVAGPIIREPDGLAMSSRNNYLDATQRQSAQCLSQSLTLAQQMVDQGAREAETIIGRAHSLIEKAPQTRIDYIRLCDPLTLEDVSAIRVPTRMLLAVWVGRTRLIDNQLLAL